MWGTFYQGPGAESKRVHDIGPGAPKLGRPFEGGVIIGPMTTKIVGKKGSRVVGEARAAAVAAAKKAYDSGDSVRAIADDMERSYGFVHRLLEEGKVRLRGRGGAYRKGKGEGETNG